MSDLDLVIRNVTVVTAGDTVRCDVRVKNGRVALLGEALPDAGESIDATDLLVLSGGIDSHVHIARTSTTDTRISRTSPSTSFD